MLVVVVCSPRSVVVVDVEWHGICVPHTVSVTPLAVTVAPGFNWLVVIVVLSLSANTGTALLIVDAVTPTVAMAIISIAIVLVWVIINPDYIIMRENKSFEDIVTHSNICSTGQVRNSNITTIFQYIRDG